MDKEFVRSEFCIVTKQGNLTFPNEEMLVHYVEEMRSRFPELDLSDAKVFIIDIYSTDKTF